MGALLTQKKASVSGSRRDLLQSSWKKMKTTANPYLKRLIAKSLVEINAATQKQLFPGMRSNVDASEFERGVPAAVPGVSMYQLDRGGYRIFYFFHLHIDRSM